MSVYVSSCPSICLPICMPVCWYAYFSVHLTPSMQWLCVDWLPVSIIVHLSACLWISVYVSHVLLSVCMYVCPHVVTYVWMSVYLSIQVCLPVRLPDHFCVSLTECMIECLPVWRSVFVYARLSVYMPVRLSICLLLHVLSVCLSSGPSVCPPVCLS